VSTEGDQNPGEENTMKFPIYLTILLFSIPLLAAGTVVDDPNYQYQPNGFCGACHQEQLADYSQSLMGKTPEPPRVYRRLHFLRGWSNEQSKQIFPGSTGTSGAHGFRAPARIFFAVVGDVFHCKEDWLYARDSA